MSNNTIYTNLKAQTHLKLDSIRRTKQTEPRSRKTNQLHFTGINHQSKQKHHNHPKTTDKPKEKRNKHLLPKFKLANGLNQCGKPKDIRVGIPIVIIVLCESESEKGEIRITQRKI